MDRRLRVLREGLARKRARRGACGSGATSCCSAQAVYFHRAREPASRSAAPEGAAPLADVTRVAVAGGGNGGRRLAPARDRDARVFELRAADAGAAAAWVDAVAEARDA